MAEGDWWRHGIIYQVYPRSFQDSDGDGVGDLNGIAARLDHLVELGVDALWLSPVFPSPMADFGYDVTDYCDIDPLFGTLADFDRLAAAAHQRGLRIILDFVPNHSSDQHPWFRQSRSSHDDPKRDWYIWRDAAPDGGPPNNWRSHFGGDAWTRDAATGQYYLHLFLPQQPDLNWRNPAVRAAMLDALRFWLDRGVDGFRVDVLWMMIKDDQFRDNPSNPDWRPGQNSHDALLPLHTADRPEMMELVATLRQVIDSYADRVLIGEIYLPIGRLVAYYGDGLRGAHLPFNFHLIQTPWHAPTLAQLIRDYEAALPPGAWPNWVLGNHDRSRIASRVGAAQARVAAMLLFTLRGTPTLYYGDELGMADVAIAPDQVQDPFERNEPGLGFGRDPVRTPMPWDGTALAGFSTHMPWLPLNLDHATVNVSAEMADPSSMLCFTRRLLALRRQHPALRQGTLHDVTATGDLLTYQRRNGETLAIALNLSATATRMTIGPARVLLSTSFSREGEMIFGETALGPDEGLLLELQ